MTYLRSGKLTELQKVEPWVWTKKLTKLTKNAYRFAKSWTMGRSKKLTKLTKFDQKCLPSCKYLNHGSGQKSWPSWLSWPTMLTELQRVELWVWAKKLTKLTKSWPSWLGWTKMLTELQVVEPWVWTKPGYIQYNQDAILKRKHARW